MTLDPDAPGDDGTPFPGGTTPGVVRVGDTVRRPRSGAHTEWVERLLRHLDEVGAAVAPRFLGVDDRGRQILEFIAGDVQSGPPFGLSDAAMASAMRLLRRFHDATAGTVWAGNAEVVCHGDLGPHNTVFRGEEAVRLIDWDDDVGPGRRAVDVADAVWGYADLTSAEVPVAEQRRRIVVCCDAYGGITPDTIVAELLAQLRRAHHNHEVAGRDAPRQVFERLIAWTERHAEALTAPVRGQARPDDPVAQSPATSPTTSSAHPQDRVTPAPPWP